VIRKTNDAVRILDKLFVKGSHRKRRAIEREKERLKIAEQFAHAKNSTPPEPLPSARGHAQTPGVFLVFAQLAMQRQQPAQAAQPRQPQRVQGEVAA